MDKSGQRLSQREINKKFIINSNRKWWRELILIFSSLMVWIYCLSVVYFFIDALLGLNHSYPRLLRIVLKINSEDVRIFTLLVILLFIIICILLNLWSFYNKQHYGNLKRRKYPPTATKEDMINLNMIDESVYEELQNMKEICFHKNPIM